MGHVDIVNWLGYGSRHKLKGSLSLSFTAAALYVAILCCVALPEVYLLAFRHGMARHSSWLFLGQS